MEAILSIDRPEFRQQLAVELGRLGIEVECFSNSPDAQRRYAAGRHAIVIGSWWQADDGDLAWCREIRQRFPHRRSVILVATDRISPAELGFIFKSGADDYLRWPAAPDILSLRLQIAIQRARDRTERERVERKLRDSIERFELAVRGANDGLWDALPLGKPWHHPDAEVWFSARFKELLGFRDDEFPNVMQSWESRLHPEDHDQVIQSLVDHIERRAPYDVKYRMQTKLGEYRWFSARGQAVWNEHGEVVRMAGSLRDITESKEYEAKLEESEEKWRSLVENAPEIVVLTDPVGTIRFVNRTLPMAEDAMGRSVYDYVDAEYQKATRDAFEALVATGKTQSYEVQSQAVGGGQAWYTARLGPIWREGKIASIVLVATNITKRKIAEDQLQRERNSLRRLLDLQERERQLVSYEIHDGLVQYLTAGLMHLEASTEPQESMPPEARVEYQRGVGLLREALAEGRRLISDLRPPILDERGVVAALEYLVHEFQHDVPDLKFTEHAHCGRLAPPLEVAIFRITQEALSNIRKHSEAKRAQVELVRHGDWLRLCVRDWGKGFNPEAVREDRYGLQGIRQRARLIGTRAVIDSAPGKGTAIVVDFPIVNHDATKKSP